MSNATFHPTQIGSVPTGSQNATQNVSTLFFGRIVSGSNPYDAPGFGQLTRPDYLETMVINLVDARAPQALVQRGTITLNIGDILSFITADGANFPTNLNLTLKEVLVCDQGTTKNMVIIGSQTYPTGHA